MEQRTVSLSLAERDKTGRSRSTRTNNSNTITSSGARHTRTPQILRLQEVLPRISSLLLSLHQVLVLLVLLYVIPSSLSFTPLSKSARLSKQPTNTATTGEGTHNHTHTLNMSTSKYEPGVEITDSAHEYIQSVQSNSSSLYIFGYGSLCWNPGSGILAHPSVSSQRGKALGYKRCWSQRSTDHRGNTIFPGLVCTLLSDKEYDEILRMHGGRGEMDMNMEDRDGTGTIRSMTEGVLFEIPHELVQECLDELDFREKGGYSRDVISVLLDSPSPNKNLNRNMDAGEDDDNNTIQALLYRGTPSNPSFTNRALLDKVYAAAVISAAIGPSGKNDAYLYELNDFMMAAVDGDGKEGLVENYKGDSLTGELTSLSKHMQEHHHVYFLYGSGSNQHNQLLLEINTSNADDGTPSEVNAANLIKGDEAHDLKEMVLLVPKIKNDDDDTSGGHQVKNLYAGGAHCALLTDAGHMYLWGLNDCNQLGTSSISTISASTKDQMELNYPIVSPLDDILVEMAALGHDHTLVIEKGTRVLYSFGNDNRGQVSGNIGGSNSNSKLTRLDLGSQVIHVSAGLFHSAAVTANGELVTFGCSKFGQSFRRDINVSAETMEDVKRWKPDDGSHIIKVACGRRHTVCLDDRGRVYSMGNNKYGQLGRQVVDDSTSGSRTGSGKKSASDGEMRLVTFPNDERCIDIDCGWHHSIALVENGMDNDHNIDCSNSSSSSTSLYGFGRNDKGQLGIGSEGSEQAKANVVNDKMTMIPSPVKIPIGKDTCDGVDSNVDFVIKHFSCGAESTSIVDQKGRIISCGWNEHGNLGCGVKNATNAANSAETEVEMHECRHTFTQAIGADICSPQSPRRSKTDDSDDANTTTTMGRRIILASGGAHLIATIV